MLRWVVALIAVGCGPRAAEVETVPPASIESEPASSPSPGPPPAEPIQAPDLAMLELAPIDDADVGKPPPSKPTGEPITFAVKRLPVGTLRVRSSINRQTYGINPGGPPRQVTIRRLQQTESIVEVDGDRIAALEVAVDVADELLQIPGQPVNRTPLLQGTYIVKAANEGGLDVEHKTGREVGSREVEELGYALAGELKDPWMSTFLGSIGLRAGETRELGEKEKRIMAGGNQPIPAPIFLSLIEATEVTATFQMNISATNVGMFKAHKTRQTVTVRRSDGQILGSTGITERVDTHNDRSELIDRVVVTYAP